MVAMYYVVAMVASILAAVDCIKEKPKGISQHQYCHGCMATMKELVKKVPSNVKRSREVKVIDALEKICTPPNFVSYDYSPPKTVKACQILLEHNEEEIETALTKNKEDDIISFICNKISGACNGVDLGKDAKGTKYADIDLTKDGDGDGSTKSVQVDPATGKVVPEGKEKTKPAKEAKTLSKSGKKKSKKQKKKGEGSKSKENKGKESKSGGGKQKGAIHNLNVDINDPDSLKRVMEQINELTGKYNAEGNEKDEL